MTLGDGYGGGGDKPDTRLSGLPARSPKASDTRTGYQRDRDRVLYSAAFQRLSTTTQVGTHSTAHVVHNRYSHSIKVAQVARRAAEHWLNEYEAKGIAEALDADVVETAALAHDLGHPPFGHLGEAVLRDFTEVHVAPAFPGWIFEGNAQSFRVLTRLALASDGSKGLDLTLRVLRATLKYPYGWREGKKKWGFYPSEHAVAIRAMGYDGVSSIEASIMDWADDVTYAIHDFQDFFRAGLIDIGELLADPIAAVGFVDHLGRANRADLASHVRFQDQSAEEVGGDELLANPALRKDVIEGGDVHVIKLAQLQELPRRHRGSKQDRLDLSHWAAGRIGEWQTAAKLKLDNGDWSLDPGDEAELERDFLKQLLWFYVIDQPGLRHQQAGQEHVLHVVLNHFLEAAGIVPVTGWNPRTPLDKNANDQLGGWHYDESRAILPRFPAAQRELLAELQELAADKDILDDIERRGYPRSWEVAYRYLAPEAVVDLIASMPEPAVSELYETLRCGRSGDLRDRGVY